MKKITNAVLLSVFSLGLMLLALAPVRGQTSGTKQCDINQRKAAEAAAPYGVSKSSGTTQAPDSKTMPFPTETSHGVTGGSQHNTGY